MKFTKRFLAILLAVLTAVSMCQPASAVSARSAARQAPQINSSEDYEQLVQSARGRFYGNQFYGFLRLLRGFARMVFGQMLMPDRNFKVTIDPILEEYCARIAADSQLDIKRILTSLPETSKPAELIHRTFKFDTDAMRAELYKVRDKYNDEGLPGIAFVFYFMGVYFSVLEGCEVLAEPTGTEHEHQVKLIIHYQNGSTEELHPGIYINGETGQAYKPNGKGIIDLGYNCSVYDMLIYATVDAWMRQFGFCVWYDLLSDLAPNWMIHYATRRFKFDYGDREWMIQIWKGSYLITNGGEVGIYNREKEKNGSYYDSARDEDMLVMSLEVYNGREKIVSLPAQRHWWVNGFKLTKNIAAPAALTLRASIEMKDEQMLDAFCKAIDREMHRDVTYTTEGLTVYLEWLSVNKP